MKKGISRLNGKDDTYLLYSVDCQCTDTDHAQQVWMEVSKDGFIEVEASQLYDCSRYGNGILTRIKKALALLFNYKATVHASIMFDEEGCRDYAEALLTGLDKLKEFNNENSR